LIVLATVFFMAWYKEVMQSSLVVYQGIFHLSLVGYSMLYNSKVRHN